MIAIYPVTALLAAAQAMQAVYAQFKATGHSGPPAAPLMPFGEMTELMGFKEVWDFIEYESNKNFIWIYNESRLKDLKTKINTALETEEISW